MKFIKSIIAQHLYQRTLHLMGISSPTLALDSIRKATKWEPNEKYKPRYLSVQSDLEIGFGDKNKAFETLTTARQIIEKYNDYWSTDAHKDIAMRIIRSLEDLKKSET